MFGNVPVDLQSEETSFAPKSTYGSSKLFARLMKLNSRERFGIFGSSGILFNHESPLRSKAFVTLKISDAVAQVSLGQEKLQV